MKKLSVKSIAVCLMAFLMIGLCIAFTACGDKSPEQTDDTGNTDITDDTGNTDDTDDAGETPPVTVYTFESYSATVNGENVPVSDEEFDMYEGAQAYFKDEKFYMTMYGIEMGYPYTYEDGIYVIDLSNLPGAEYIATTTTVVVNTDTLTVTMVDNASTETLIFKA